MAYFAFDPFSAVDYIICIVEFEIISKIESEIKSLLATAQPNNSVKLSACSLDFNPYRLLLFL